jgi:hypothetical protein
MIQKMNGTSMSDFADRAQSITELHITKSISEHSTTAKPFSGVCIACGEPVDQRRYCDKHCREDHEKEMKQRFIR